ncbi:arabinose efflux permease family protein [Haloferax elongans ATCC BAA-1513]|uniref:Arabinose efflux permease family protein n=1 Tax=Haloferax elongans ATCC BAA-1513 TaxID=1230453 RepID=M0HVB5_HALEO|nr:MFS transporter [Haloferax elongans]ELZ87703.1 arabinose efflux permease family protein [Haloferax elongans ATCC BAA-1513]
MYSRLSDLLASLRSHYATLSHLRDRTVAVLAVSNLLDHASNSFVIPLLPAYAATFGIGPVALGLLFSLPVASQAVFSLAFGSLSDRFGRRPFMVVGMLVGAVSVVGLGVADSVPALLALRALDGVGAAMRGPATSAYLGDYTSDDERAGVMGAYQTSGMAAVALGPALGGALYGAGPEVPFLVLGGLTALGGLIMVGFLPPVDTESDEDESEPSGPLVERVRRSVSVVRDPTVAALVVGGFVASVADGAFAPTLAPLLEQSVGGGPTYAALVWSVLGATMLVVVPVGGSLADDFGRKRGVVVGKLVWVAVPIGIVFAPHQSVPIALFALGGVGSGLAGPALGALRYEIAPDGREGTTLGLISTAASVGGALGPVLGGALTASASLGATALGIGLLWAVDPALLYWFVPDDSPAVDEEAASEGAATDIDAS